ETFLEKPGVFLTNGERDCLKVKLSLSSKEALIFNPSSLILPAPQITLFITSIIRLLLHFFTTCA
ncbi:MAG TPA: hypothetical protein PL110_17355, partial [Candidatus Eremiobacteraeota bacterium]|nr:hypothetical protein [Candidatus Eremiobacteraeota bacterium]